MSSHTLVNKEKTAYKKEVFISRLKDAGDPDEIRRILTESGYTPSEEAVNSIRELINAETETKCRDLSADELSVVRLRGPDDVQSHTGSKQ